MCKSIDIPELDGAGFDINGINHYKEKLNLDHQEWKFLRKEWTNSKRTPLTHSIKEWEYLGKPRPKNAYNK